jgi:hypothetical protein
MADLELECLDLGFPGFLGFFFQFARIIKLVGVVP